MQNVLSPRDLLFRPDIGHKLYHHQLISTFDFATWIVLSPSYIRKLKQLAIFCGCTADMVEIHEGQVFS